ncbi:hypothetical protein A2372_02100 [Candidatus Wolfebacteria bacterium RIFOXYB1_FULL_54_12]|uniref:DUF8128 domain-containing protein n=1 Tax=Candidatus Wolfebacteria bacterium RIFOXYB1_FULL_54_12 TaxID=1802559 RepID=A0A1F8DXH2_9BACT|nr:MAG: hypothetical protein A2372_02100 [Candidatus Wolfebacteria bacterium RIFOXYB1_FULL_54_12]
MANISDFLLDYFSITPVVQNIILGIAQSIGEVFSYVWWAVVPVVLAFYLWDLYIDSNKKAAKKAQKWVVLELRIPKENLRSPKSMEQVFATVHGTYAGEIKWWDENIKGKVQNALSFEMVGRSGGVYFYVRVPAEHRNLVESALFAQYPAAEIALVEDYLSFLPMMLPNDVYDVWGVDMVLDKDSAYPIKTYAYFEEKEEEQRLDPLTVILETMSKLRENEMIFVQYISKPTGEKTSDYKKKGQAIVDKMLGREVKVAPKLSIFDHLVMWIKNFFLVFISTPEWPEPPKKSDAPPKTIASLSFSEKEVLEGIEGKISKLCYEVSVRAVFIDRQETFHKSYIGGIIGSFKQFGSQHINSFKPNRDTSVNPPKGFKAWLFPAWKKHQEFLKKRAMFFAYRQRIMIKKAPVFSIEELATLYHVPSSLVTAPSMRRIEAKKGEPPENLPIE